MIFESFNDNSKNRVLRDMRHDQNTRVLKFSTSQNNKTNWRQTVTITVTYVNIAISNTTEQYKNYSTADRILVLDRSKVIQTKIVTKKNYSYI